MFLKPNPNLDIMGENIAMIFALLTLFFMVKTRPRRTRIFIYDIAGMVLAAIEISLNVFVLLYPSNGNFNYSIYFSVLIAFHVTYMLLLNCIYGYAWQLSYRQRLRKHILFIELTIFNLFYAAIYFFLFKYELIFYVEDGVVYAGDCFSLYLFFGLFVAVSTIVQSTIHKREIPKAIHNYVLLFGSLDAVILILQLLKPNVIFASITYVAPFLIYYLLFHSNPMDEVSGCRNGFSFETVFMQNKRLRKDCTILYGTIRNLPTDFMSGYNERISYMISDKCRHIEAISHNLKIYTLDPTVYMTFIYGKTSKRDEIVNKIAEVISAPISIGNSNAKVNYKLYRVDKIVDLDNTSKFYQFIQYLSSKHDLDIYTNQYYQATDEDYERFRERSKVADALLEIRKDRNLDDERVLCYAQPIHSVKDGRYKTAESLMRMKIDGKLYFPDTFIPVSEETNCVHALTLIMINKVCKQIKELEGKYDFDCITVNCSTLEFTDIRFADEVLAIIDANEVPRNKIRLELTESSVSSSYNTLMQNMNKLRDAGVLFYLDDFGTGYSNFDRILSCPFNVVKFDKSILYKAMDDKFMYSVVCGMVEAFKSKGFNTLVEGVEDEAQRDRSIEIGFEYIQGYHYSKPVPIQEMPNYFTSITANSDTIS